MNENLKSVLNEIKEGKARPCYLIYGDEKYLVKKALDAVVDCLLPAEEKGDFNLFLVDGENEDVDSICESLLTPSLVSGRKVVVIKNTRLFYSKSSSNVKIEEVIENLKKNPRKAAETFMAFLKISGLSLEDIKDGGWKKISDDDWKSISGTHIPAGKEKWLPEVIDLCVNLKITPKQKHENTEWLEEILRDGIPNGNCLVMTADAVDKRKGLFKVVSGIGTVIEFSSVKGESRRKNLLIETAKDILDKKGKRLAPAAFLALGNKTGFDIQKSAEELEKLIAYVGTRNTIEKEDIDAVTERTKEYSVFDLISAVTEKDTAKALEVLDRILDQGVHHLVVSAMLAKETRFLVQGKIMLKSNELSSFSEGMNYNRFQGGIYPEVKSMSKRWSGSNKGEWLINQHPYVVYNTLKNACGSPWEELVRNMERIIDADTTLKTTDTNPKFVIRRLLIDMCQ